MKFSSRIRYGLVSVAILVASFIQLARGYRLVIVAVCGLTFLFVGNLIVFLSGSEERAIRRRQKQEYYR